jgi:hypothetical protein
MPTTIIAATALSDFCGNVKLALHAMRLFEFTMRTPLLPSSVAGL